MIESIRNAATSLAAKLLLGLLVLSFAVWGVGDWLRVGQYTAVAEVDGEEISVIEFQREFQTAMRNLGPQVNVQTAQAFGLDRFVLGDMLRRAALDQEARAAGLSVPDSAIAEFIRNSPLFAAPGGDFEQVRYELFLQSRGLRRQEYEAQLRRDVARGLLVRAAADGATVSRGGLERVWLQANETRDIAYLVISPDAQGAPAAPTEADLAAFHTENAERFTAPELRTLRYIWLRAADRADPETVAEDRIAERYDARRGEYNRPERRNLEQIVFDDEEAAAAAADRVADGELFARIAEERGLGPDDVALGYVTEDEIAALRPTVAEAAFSGRDSGIVGPIETPTGWAVINIRGVIPARVTTLEDASAEIAAEIAEEDARRELADAANAVEDLRAAGADFAEIAEAEPLTLRTVTVDRDGRDAEGRPVEDLPHRAAFLTRAFEMERDEEMDLEEAPNQEYYALEVVETQAAALRPLDTVRDRVADAWRDARRAEAAAAAAAAYEARLNAGETLDAVAEADGLELRSAANLTRSDQHPLLPGALIQAAFAAEPGAPLRGTLETDAEGAPAGSEIVAAVTTVTAADADAGAAAVDAQIAAAAQSAEGDIAALFAAAALENRPYSTQPAAVEAALTAHAQGGM